MINRVTATGSIVSIKKNSNYSGCITIAQKMNYRIRKNGHGENAVRDDYLVFHYNEYSDIKDIVNKLCIGDRVEIEGCAGSYLKRNHDGTTKECVNLYIKNIRLEKTEFYKTFGIAGGHYAQDSNAFCLEAKIEALILCGKMVKLRLDASDYKKTNVINMFAGNSIADEVKRFSIGDNVYVSALIKTVPLDESIEHRDYNKFTVTAIAKAE